MKLLLVRPPDNEDVSIEVTESMSLAYLATYLRGEGISVEIYDAYLEEDSINKAVLKIYESNPELLGFTVMANISFEVVLKIVARLRSNGFKGHIFLGGHFPTFNHRNILEKYSEIDSIIRGEGEKSLLDLYQCLSNGMSLKMVKGITFRDGGKIVENSNREIIEDLDMLPFPDRDTINTVISKGGVPYLVTSRGCPSRCSFCSVALFNSYNDSMRWRSRSPRNIVDEIEKLVEEYNVFEFLIIDENFLGKGSNGSKRIEIFINELENRNLKIQYIMGCRADSVNEELFKKLKESGLRRVLIGIESFLPRVLHDLNKKITYEQNIEALSVLRKLKIGVNTGFMLFDPYASLDDIKENLKHLKNSMCFELNTLFTVIRPFYGTPIFDKYNDEGMISGDIYNPALSFRDKKVEELFAFKDSLKICFPLYDLIRESKKIMLRKFSLDSLENQTFRDIEDISNLFYLDIFERMVELVENNDGAISDGVRNEFESKICEETKNLLNMIRIILREKQLIEIDFRYEPTRQTIFG